MRAVTPLTDFEKNLIAHLMEKNYTVSGAARTLHRNASTVYYYARTHGLLDPARKKHLWTKQEDTYIESAIDQGQPYFRISQALHYPLDIIRHRAYELGCAAQARNYPVCRVAQMFAVSDKIIKRWITLKALHATNNGTRKLKHFIVSEDALYEFLETERWWYLWDAPQIVDGVLRQYAMEIRNGKHWFNAKQAGHILGYTREGLRPYILRGLCRVVLRTPTRGCHSYAIREDWIEDARQRMRDGGPPWWGNDPLDKPLWLANLEGD